MILTKGSALDKQVFMKKKGGGSIGIDGTTVPVKTDKIGYNLGASLLAR